MRDKIKQLRTLQTAEVERVAPFLSEPNKFKVLPFGIKPLCGISQKDRDKLKANGWRFERGLEVWCE